MISIRIPKPGPDFDNATITSWEKSEGDRIRIGDVIAIIKTSIGSFRVTAEEEGTLASIIQKAASTIDFETPIAMLAQDSKPVETSPESNNTPPPVESQPSETAPEPTAPTAAEPSPTADSTTPSAEQPPLEHPATPIEVPEQPVPDPAQAPTDISEPTPEPPTPTQPEPEPKTKSSAKPHGVKVSPAARSLAEKFGVDLSIIKGTGEDGRILYIDVEDYLSSHPEAPEPVAATEEPPTPSEPVALPDAALAASEVQQPVTEAIPHPEPEQAATSPAQPIAENESDTEEGDQGDLQPEPVAEQTTSEPPAESVESEENKPAEESNTASEAPEDLHVAEAQAADSDSPAQDIQTGQITTTTEEESTDSEQDTPSEIVAIPDRDEPESSEDEPEVPVFSDLEVEPPFTPKPPSEDVPWYAGRGLTEILSELLSTPISPNQGDVADLFFLSKDGEEVTIPFTTLKRSYADLQVESIHNKPRLHLFAEIDFSDALRWMTRYNESNMVEVCTTDILMKVAGYVLTLMPEMNSHVQQDSLVLKRSINIGIVTSLEEGVVIPVVSNVGRLPFLQMVETVRKNLSMATKSKLVVDDDPTFTLFDLGAFGVSSFIPLILPPQSCCLAIGCLQKKVAVVNDALAIRNMIQVTLACDPRGIDGVTAARFLNKLKHEIESVRPDTDPDWLGSDPGQQES